MRGNSQVEYPNSGTPPAMPRNRARKRGTDAWNAAGPEPEPGQPTANKGVSPFGPTNRARYRCCAIIG